MTSVRKKLTYANVMSTIAVVLAFAGGSTAVAISASKKAPKNSVAAKAIKPGNVTASKLARVNVVMTQEATAGAQDTVRADCPFGEKLIGGGAKSLPVTIPAAAAPRPLGSSYPDGNGWVAQLADQDGALATYALCLRGAPGL